MDRGIYKYKCSDCGHEFIGVDMELNCTAESAPVNAQSVAVLIPILLGHYCFI